MKRHSLIKYWSVITVLIDMPRFSASLGKIFRSESSSGPPHQTSPPAAAVLLAAQSKTTFASESFLYTEGDSCYILQLNVTCGVQVNHICTLQLNKIFVFQTHHCGYVTHLQSSFLLVLGFA